MLSTSLLSRSLGLTSSFSFAQDQTNRWTNALQAANHERFQGASQKGTRRNASADDEEVSIAHAAGVNAIQVDKFEGRYLLSGAADGEVSIWDLEAPAISDVQDKYSFTGSHRPNITHTPLSCAPKSLKTHTHGITSLHYYPFDSLAFTTSSYDHTLKLWDATCLRPSATFNPSDSPVYAHATSPIASHLLVACGTQHPAVRLVDLRSGAMTHTLAGHGGGAVLSLAWSPREENVLASGGVDGTVRLWDVRRSAGCLGVLDMEDGVGVGGFDGLGRGARSRFRGVAHNGPVNGLVWVDDARYLVSTGHDEKVRVWDCHSGANTFATFGPVLRNRTVAGVVPMLVPKRWMRRGEEVLFFPSEKEMLVFELFEGSLIKRLKAPSLLSSTKGGTSDRNIRERVTALTWKHHDVAMYSAHGDGSIRSWQPRTFEDAFVEEADSIQDDNGSAVTRDRKRKRQVLEDIEQELTKPKVTFT